MGLLCLLLVNSFNTNYCANWNFIETNKYVSSGLEKLSSGDYNGALADFDALIRLDPYKDQNAYVARGMAKYMLGDFQGALADFDRAIELGSNRVEAYYNRGAAKYMLGDFEGAEADISKAREQDPALPDYGVETVKVGERLT